METLKFIIWLCYLYGQPVHSMSDLGDRRFDAQTHCHSLRREMVFPVAVDTTSTARDIFSQSTSADVLRLRISWRGESLTMVLQKTSVSSPASVSEWDDGNMLKVENVDISCTYEGHVQDQQESSFVAVTTCGGLSGLIQTDKEMLFIRPASDLTDGDDNDDDINNNAHIIYTCEPEEMNETQDEADDIQERRRRRSASPTRYVEVQAVVDHTLVETFGTTNKTIEYVMTLMNIANTVYQHKTLDQNIRVAVVKFVLLSKNQQKEVLSLKRPDVTIDKFCKWAVRQRNGKAADYDLSMLITEDNFGHADTAGYAPVGVMCRQDSNCFAIQDRGFFSGFVIAHEIGHIFGLSHDGEKDSCSGTKYKNSVMSAFVLPSFNHVWWSECSRKSLAKKIKSFQCLNNRPVEVDNHYMLTASQKFEEDLGISWSLEFQCQKEFGEQYEFCKNSRNDPCKELLCVEKTNPKACFTRRSIPLPGTNCAQNKVCFNMTCVERTFGPRPDVVDGTWSQWSEWSQCNAGCGVGIKTRFRTCTFPPNTHRGWDCEGDANEMMTCADYTCKEFEDKREEECAAWKKKKKTRKWLPHGTRKASLNCLQICKSLPSGDIFVGKDHVADGTPCNYEQDSSDICVNGKCTKVGCDGELGSSKKLDMCGNCNGNGSLCKTFVGQFNKRSPSVRRYLKVLTIPAGARHILIYKRSHTSSFLALKDSRKQTYIFNGNRKYTQHSSQVHKGAIFFYNHGDSRYSEMISTPGPLQDAMDVMMYFKTKVDAVRIFYNFTVPKDDDTFEKSQFKWKFESWSSCSVTCGRGSRQTVYGCYEKTSNKKIDDTLCSALKSPRIHKSICTLPKCKQKPISYKWKATDNWTECDAKCGESGEQSRLYQCQRMRGNKVITNVNKGFCKKVKKNDETRRCTGPACTYRWLATEKWTKCDAKCDKKGNHSRIYQCQKTDGNELIKDAKAQLCAGVEHDNEKKECAGPVCKLKWQQSNWSECSVTCGRGKQQREVFCGDPDTYEDDFKCQGKRPLATKRCVLPFCPEPQDGICKDHFSFCSLYSSLKKKCKAAEFKTKCCETCKKQG